MTKTYTGKFKAKVVLEIFKEERTIPEIASQYEVHPNQLSKWKKEAINGISTAPAAAKYFLLFSKIKG